MVERRVKIDPAGEDTMTMTRGEIYACPNSECGAEITVTRGVKADAGGELEPRCSCGRPMKRRIETSMRV